MSVIIELIIALLPVVINWLITLLHQQSATLERTGNDADDAKTLLTICLAATPASSIFKRATLRVLIWHVPEAIRTKQKLPNDIVTELVALSTATPSK